HPDWLSSENLIGKSDAENAEIKVLDQDVLILSLEWCELLVTDSKFQIASTLASSYEIMRDFVVGAFQLLSYTPLRQMGINSNVHYQAESEKSWKNLESNFAAVSRWE